MGDTTRCKWCEKPAEFLCDFPTDPAKGETCDAPMCAEHRSIVASGMVCSRRRGKDGGCRPFSIDHCPDHASQDLDWDNPPIPRGARPISSTATLGGEDLNNEKGTPC